MFSVPFTKRPIPIPSCKVSSFKMLITNILKFLQSFHILPIRSFLLEMNTNKYPLCTVYLIRHPFTQKFSIQSNQVTERNDILNSIQVQNYQVFPNPIFFTWVITNESVQIVDYKFDRELCWKTSNPLLTCQIVHTEIMMIGWARKLTEYELESYYFKINYFNISHCTRSLFWHSSSSPSNSCMYSTLPNIHNIL